MTTMQIEKTFRSHLRYASDVEAEAKRLTFAGYGEKALKSFKTVGDGAWEFYHDTEHGRTKYRIEYDMQFPEEGSPNPVFTIMYWLMRV